MCCSRSSDKAHVISIIRILQYLSQHCPVLTQIMDSKIYPAITFNIKTSSHIAAEAVNVIMLKQGAVKQQSEGALALSSHPTVLSVSIRFVSLAKTAICWPLAGITPQGEQQLMRHESHLCCHHQQQVHAIAVIEWMQGCKLRSQDSNTSTQTRGGSVWLTSDVLPHCVSSSETCTLVHHSQTQLYTPVRCCPLVGCRGSATGPENKTIHVQ